jgi:hypothetical protein
MNELKVVVVVVEVEVVVVVVAFVVVVEAHPAITAAIPRIRTRAGSHFPFITITLLY